MPCIHAAYSTGVRNVLNPVHAAQMYRRDVSSSLCSINLTSSIPSYSEENNENVKICPLEGGSYVSFNCDVNETNLSWNFNGITKTFFYSDYSNAGAIRNWREHTKSEDYGDIYFLLYSGTYMIHQSKMRSALIVFPPMGSFNFSVQCSFYCQEQQILKRKIYRQAGEFMHGL